MMITLDCTLSCCDCVCLWAQNTQDIDSGKKIQFKPNQSNKQIFQFFFIAATVFVITHSQSDNFLFVCLFVSASISISFHHHIYIYHVCLKFNISDKKERKRKFKFKSSYIYYSVFIIIIHHLLFINISFITHIHTVNFSNQISRINQNY